MEYAQEFGLILRNYIDIASIVSLTRTCKAYLPITMNIRRTEFVCSVIDDNPRLVLYLLNAADCEYYASDNGNIIADVLAKWLIYDSNETDDNYDEWIAVVMKFIDYITSSDCLSEDHANSHCTKAMISLVNTGLVPIFADTLVDYGTSSREFWKNVRINSYTADYLSELLPKEYIGNSTYYDIVGEISRDSWETISLHMGRINEGHAFTTTLTADWIINNHKEHEKLCKLAIQQHTWQSDTINKHNKDIIARIICKLCPKHTYKYFKANYLVNIDEIPHVYINDRSVLSDYKILCDDKIIITSVPRRIMDHLVFRENTNVLCSIYEKRRKWTPAEIETAKTSFKENAGYYEPMRFNKLYIYYLQLVGIELMGYDKCELYYAVTLEYASWIEFLYSKRVPLPSNFYSPQFTAMNISSQLTLLKFMYIHK